MRFLAAAALVLGALAWAAEPVRDLSKGPQSGSAELERAREACERVGDCDERDRLEALETAARRAARRAWAADAGR